MKERGNKMKRRHSKLIYDAQYKCRRCGGFYDDALKECPTHGHGYPLFLERLYWNQAELKEMKRDISRVNPVFERFIGDNPEALKVHRCPDDEMGLGDLVGLVNRREVRPHGRGWKVVPEEEETK